MALPTGCPRSPARLGRLTPFPNGFRLSTGLRRAGAAPGGAPHPTPLRCCCRCVWRRGFPAAMASQTWRGGGGYYTAARSCSLPVKRTPHGRGRRLPRSPPPRRPRQEARVAAVPARPPVRLRRRKRNGAPLLSPGVPAPRLPAPPAAVQLRGAGAAVSALPGPRWQPARIPPSSIFSLSARPHAGTDRTRPPRARPFPPGRRRQRAGCHGPGGAAGGRRGPPGAGQRSPGLAGPRPCEAEARCPPPP